MGRDIYVAAAKPACIDGLHAGSHATADPLPPPFTRGAQRRVHQVAAPVAAIARLGS